MPLFNTLALFFVGFFILVRGAKILIRGASSLARLFNVSDWVIGVVIVGIGTSLPELSINFASVFTGRDVGLGTIIGSNTFNTLVILGLVALWRPIVFRPIWLRRDLLINILAILAVMFLFAVPLLGDPGVVGLSRPEGVLLLSFFLVWLWYMVHRRRDGSDAEGPPTDYKVLTFSLSALLVAGGVLGVFVGGRWVVDGAAAIARLLGASDTLIGLTLVGIGTSLPELTVSFTAWMRRQPSLAVGNIIGSNIFDFLGIFSLVPLLKPLPFPSQLWPDLVMTLIASLILAAALLSGARYRLERWHGVLFILLYFIYLGTLFWR